MDNWNKILITYKAINAKLLKLRTMDNPTAEVYHDGFTDTLFFFNKVAFKQAIRSVDVINSNEINVAGIPGSLSSYNQNLIRDLDAGGNEWDVTRLGDCVQDLIYASEYLIEVTTHVMSVI